MRHKRTLLQEPGFWAGAACVLPVVWFSAIGGSFGWLPFMAVGQGIVLGLYGLLFLEFPRLVRGLSAVEQEQRAIRVRRASLVGLWALVLVSVLTTHWPLHLSFLYARPALEQIADQVERGEKPDLPRRAGLLDIRRAKLENQFIGQKPSPCVWITDYHTSPEDSGFMRGSYETYKTWEAESGTCFPINLRYLGSNWFQTQSD